MMRMSAKHTIGLIGAVITIAAIVTAMILYVQLVTGSISLAEYLTEMAKSQVPGWVPILIACPIVGVIIILVIAYIQREG